MKLKKLPKASTNFKTLLLQSFLFFIIAFIYYLLQKSDVNIFLTVMQIICIILGVIWLFLACVNYYWNSLYCCVILNDIIVLIFKRTFFYIPYNEEHLRILRKVIDDESYFYSMKNK